MKSKALLFLPSIVIETPKYFPKSMEHLIPSSVSMEFMSPALVIREKKIFDSPRFTFWLEEVQNSLRTFLMERQFFLVAFAKRIRSSAKNRCEKEGPSLEVFTPDQFPRMTFNWMSQAKYSMQRMKMYDEKGSPWQMPLE